MGGDYNGEVKDFERLRQILNLFYVDGSRQKKEYQASFYKNCLRFTKSTFEKDGFVVSKRKGGGRSFLSLDSRSFSSNPLYQTFGEKTFTKNDCILYFEILDILGDYGEMSYDEIQSSRSRALDSKTIRKKLNEMVSLGILLQRKEGNRNLYRTSEKLPGIEHFGDLLAFFSEIAPVGVLGYYICKDFCSDHESEIVYKNYFINYALDSEVLCLILTSIREKCRLSFEYSPIESRLIKEKKEALEVCPIKVFSSSQDGRQYLLCYNYSWKHYDIFRIDRIRYVKNIGPDDCFDQHQEYYLSRKTLLWGPALSRETSYFEMAISVSPDEKYIVDRLSREKRTLSLEKLDDNHYRVYGDIIHPKGLKNWVRSFFGRICKLECSDPSLKKELLDDLKLMKEEYDAI